MLLATMHLAAHLGKTNKRNKVRVERARKRRGMSMWLQARRPKCGRASEGDRGGVEGGGDGVCRHTNIDDGHEG